MWLVFWGRVEKTTFAKFSHCDFRVQKQIQFFLEMSAIEQLVKTIYLLIEINIMFLVGGREAGKRLTKKGHKKYQPEWGHFWLKMASVFGSLCNFSQFSKKNKQTRNK